MARTFLRPGLAVLAFMAAALILRFPQVHRGLPAARHPDSAKTVAVAQKLAKAWRAGDLELDPGFYQYPTLYANTLALVFLLDPSLDAEAAGRLMTLLAGLLFIPLAFILGLQLRDAETGLWSACLAASGGLFTLQGRAPSPDALQAALALLSAVFLFNERWSRRARLLASGAAAGLAVGAKYTAALSLLPLFLCVSCGASPVFEAKRVLRAGAAWGAALGAGFLASTPAILWRGPRFWDRLMVESRMQSLGCIGEPYSGFWDYFLASSPLPSSTPFPNSLPGTLGWPFALLLAVAPAWLALSAWRRRDARQLGLACACACGLVFFSAYSQVRRVRFLLPAAAFGAVLVPLFLQEAVDRLKGLALGPRARRLLCLALFGLVLAPSLAGSLSYRDRLREDDDTRLQAARWILAQVPAGAKILNFQHGPALPAGRYNAVQWIFPETLWELEQAGLSAAPALERLKREGVEWVIWNSDYAGRFANAGRSPLEQAYLEAWQVFERDLKAVSLRGHGANFSGGLPPEVSIYRLPTPREKRTRVGL